MEKNNQTKILYISSIEFLRELEYAIQEKMFYDFLGKYKKYDVLIIEDIHYLQRTMIYEKDFWRLLNENFLSRKVKTQIIFSTTINPYEMGFFTKNDIGSGLVAEVQLADLKKLSKIDIKSMEFIR